MDQHSRPHHVLVQTGYSQIWSLGATNASGTICAQGQHDRSLVIAPNILSLCYKTFWPKCISATARGVQFSSVNIKCAAFLLSLYNICPVHISQKAPSITIKLDIASPKPILPSSQWHLSLGQTVLVSPLAWGSLGHTLAHTLAHIHTNSQGHYLQSNRTDSY